MPGNGVSPLCKDSWEQWLKGIMDEICKDNFLARRLKTNRSASIAMPMMAEIDNINSGSVIRVEYTSKSNKIMAWMFRLRIFEFALAVGLCRYGFFCSNLSFLCK